MIDKSLAFLVVPYCGLIVCVLGPEISLQSIGTGFQY